MKKKLAITLIVIMLLSIFLIGCDKASTQSENVVKPNGETLELTILCSMDNINFLKNNPTLVEYEKSFEKNFGVKVTYLSIGTLLNSDENINNYMKDLATKLYTEDGAELIYCRNTFIDSFIKQKAVLDLGGKVKDINKIYDGLLSKEVFFIPLGIEDRAIILNKDVLSELGLKEPNLNWSVNDYYEIRDKWFNKEVRAFTSGDYFDIYNKYLSDIKVFDMANNKAHINTVEIATYIQKMREDIFNGKYKLRNYTFENYYNMTFVPTSKEYKDSYNIYSSTEYKNSNFRNSSLEYSLNPFKATDISWNLNRTIILPDVRNTNRYIMSWGYMVNANGKNLDLAYEFINGMLEDEFQLKILEDDNLMYPVNKNIEAEIMNLEINQGADEKSIEIKKYFLDQVKNSKYKLGITRSYKEQQLREMLMKDLSKFVFADNSYTDAEISEELQKLENRYNIWLNE